MSLSPRPLPTPLQLALGLGIGLGLGLPFLAILVGSAFWLHRGRAARGGGASPAGLSAAA